MFNVGHRLLNGTLVAALLLAAAPAFVQRASAGEGIGVVTAIQGQATVARQALPQPAALRFKDDVFFRDQIATREHSTVRLLLGGKGSLTVREQSQVTLDESVAPDGARRSVLGLIAGKIGAAIAHALMRPGESVEIHTPNAVAAVRGTVLIAEYIPPQGSAANRQPVLLASAAPGPFLAQAPGGAGGTSNFFVLSGQVTITPQGLQPLTLGPLQALSITQTPTGAQPGAVQTLTPAQAAQAAEGLQTGKPHTGEAEAGRAAQAQAQMAAALADLVLQNVPGGPPPGFAPPAPTTTVAPIVPPVASTSWAGSGLLNNGGLETGDLTHWTAGGAASVISNFGPGVFSPPGGSYMALIHTGYDSMEVNTTTSSLRQSVESLSSGSVYLVTFKYNFMSNEYPTQAETFNDTFEAKLIDGESSTVLATASRNTEEFKTDKPSISGGTFTLSQGNGYTDFQSASKTVVVNGSSATLEFKIYDVGDTVVDSGSLIDNVSFALDPPLYLLTNGQTLTKPGPDPLVDISNQSLTFDSVLVSSGRPPEGSWSVDLGGPLLHVRRATLSVPFSLLGLLDGSTLRTSSSEPLVRLEEGTYSLSTIPGTAIFDFWGTETAVDAETGVPVGTGTTVKHPGPLLEASGGATVETQKVLKLDTALLEATAPIIRLVGSSGAQTSLTSASAPLDLIQSKVTSLGPIMALDNSVLSVTNGPLIRLTQGSSMDLTGDLLSLASGSKIKVVNGPLVSVAGAGSVLNVSGALVNFGGTGGSQIIVNNNIAPTAVLTQAGVNGIGVSATGGGSISIGPNPVKNPTLGTISVTGSLIQATNGGAVKIGAK